jgi:hypothetical protein
MAKVKPSLIEFDYDPAIAAELVDDYRTDDGEKLADCSKEELGSIADRLLHVVHFCIVTAERK